MTTIRVDRDTSCTPIVNGKTRFLLPHIESHRRPGHKYQRSSNRSVPLSTKLIAVNQWLRGAHRCGTNCSMNPQEPGTGFSRHIENEPIWTEPAYQLRHNMRITPDNAHHHVPRLSSSSRITGELPQNHYTSHLTEHQRDTLRIFTFRAANTAMLHAAFLFRTGFLTMLFATDEHLAHHFDASAIPAVRSLHRLDRTETASLDSGMNMMTELAFRRTPYTKEKEIVLFKCVNRTIRFIASHLGTLSSLKQHAKSRTVQEEIEDIHHKWTKAAEYLEDVSAALPTLQQRVHMNNRKFEDELDKVYAWQPMATQMAIDAGATFSSHQEHV